MHVLCHPGLHFRSLKTRIVTLKGRLLAEGTVSGRKISNSKCPSGMKQKYEIEISAGYKPWME
jgi:hypothetical protein